MIKTISATSTSLSGHWVTSIGVLAINGTALYLMDSSVEHVGY